MHFNVKGHIVLTATTKHMPINKKLTLINTGHLSQFKEREKQVIGIPECILEEYSLGSGSIMSDDSKTSPLKQYDAAEGFEFNWGHILERRADKYIIWDFCFTQLLSQYLRSGKRLSDLQRAFYYLLERKIACTTRDIVPVLTMQEGWKIIPCSSVGAFTLIIHFTQEEGARKWVAHDLLCQVIPEIINELQNDSSSANR